MEKTVQLANNYDVAIGAHPGLPDLVGFGRREMAVTPEEVKALIKYQVGALQAFAKDKLHHVKPHGALYNMAAREYHLAQAICQGIKEVDANLVLYGLAGSELIQAAKETGLPYAQEVFADRNVEEDGTLTPRSHNEAMITDEDVAIKRVLQMVQHNKIESISGKVISIEADTICVHGDNPRAVAFAKKIRQALMQEAIQVSPI
jgi:UPF0271 protein